MKEWPEVDDGKLFGYIFTKDVDVDYIGLCAHSFFTKCPVNSKHIFLKGCLSPSRKIHDDPHKVCLFGGDKELPQNCDFMVLIYSRYS